MTETSTPLEREFIEVSDFDDCSALLKSSDYIIPPLSRDDLAAESLDDIQIETSLIFHNAMVNRLKRAYPFDPDRRKLQAMVRRFQTGENAEKQKLAARAAFEQIMRHHKAGTPLRLEEDLATPIVIAITNALLGCHLEHGDLGQALDIGFQSLIPAQSPSMTLAGWASYRPLLSSINTVIDANAYKKDGIIAQFLEFAEQNARPRDFVIMSSALLTIAGTSLIRSIIHVVQIILENKKIQDAMHGDAVDQVFKEMLRLYPPQTCIFRYNQDHSTARRRKFFAINLQKANRDPAHFKCPHEFDPKRKPVSTLTFGAGPFACDGAALTHMFFRETVRPLIIRSHGLKLVGGKASHHGAVIYDSFE